MKRFIFFLYGIICYIIFLGAFLYAIGFTGDLVVTKTIDSGFQGGIGGTLIVNLLLLSLFAVQHSVMARQAFKKRWTKIIPRPIERNTYVLFSSLVLIILFYFWRPLPEQIWNTGGTVIAPILTVLFFGGWFVVLTGTYLINHFNLFGLQQVYLYLKKREQQYPKFVTPFYYQFVRHPLMLGFIIAFWAAPVMTLGHLLFAVASTGYILIAIQLEEQDLVRFHGEAHKRYQRKVSQIIPMPRRKNILVENVR
jgi:protein-S-isoprenylcysteine O-methyltransferase Ste14